MMEENCKRLIDLLADKKLEVGCVIKHKDGTLETIGDVILNQDKTWADYDGEYGMYGVGVNEVEILGKPVLIGDVLAKIIETDGLVLHRNENDTTELLFLWSLFGFTTSLNEILEGETETVRLDGDGLSWSEEEQFKDKNTQSLYEFLMELFSNQIK